MTKEQEIIERLNRLKTIKVLYTKTFAMTTEQLKVLQEDIETFLNMLKEKDEQIAKYEKIYKEYDCYRWVKELEKKDKQIDLMAEYIVSLDIEEDICVKTGRLNECDSIALGECENCIKQYFKELAERKSKEC